MSDLASTIRDLHTLIDQAEQRSQIRAAVKQRRVYCGNCCTDHFARFAITFCGDCGMELCKVCSFVCCLETFCEFCVVDHKANHLEC
jgi:hypothetical protein